MTYRPGNHWGVTIVREAGRQPCDDAGPHYCFVMGENSEHKSDELVAVVVNGDTGIAQRICDLLNADDTAARAELDATIARLPKDSRPGLPTVDQSDRLLTRRQENA